MAYTLLMVFENVILKEPTNGNSHESIDSTVNVIERSHDRFCLRFMVCVMILPDKVYFFPRLDLFALHLTLNSSINWNLTL